MVAPNRKATLQTVTSTTLLEGLADAEDPSLRQQYVDRYRPLIVGYARRLGVPEADAEEVAQASLMAFSTAYGQGRYDRDEGPLSAWLFGSVHRQVLNWSRRQHGDERELGEDEGAELIEQLPADDPLRRAWDAEWQDAVLRQCLSEIRHEVLPDSYRAFVEFAIEGRPADEVAAELGTSQNAVYLAKRRILTRLRDLRPLIEDLF